MRRYGFTSGLEPQLSPFTSSLSRDGVPDVTDQDYEYITSDDLQNSYDSRPDGSYFRPPNDDDLDDIPQDDVLIFRHGNRVDKEYFPAYAIGDGKLFTSDIRDRTQLLYKLSDAQTARVKIFYKGVQLKVDEQPVCLSGVKNNSELLMVLPDDDADSSESNERSQGNGKTSRQTPKNPKGRKSEHTSSQPGRQSSTSLEVPARGRDDRKGRPPSRAPSAASSVSGTSGASGMSGISGIGGSPAIPGSPMEKLNSIAQHFQSKLFPLCEQFISKPPADSKKREDDHRKLSETVFQQVLLKLDEVDTGGDDMNRARRKELVNHVQDVLKKMDGKVKISG